MAKKIILQVLNVLTYIHDQHIVHCDIKLSNLLIDTLGRIKLIDFGISRKILNTSGNLGGSPGYVPPEFFKNIFDYKSDVFSLGAVFYMIMSLEFPFFRSSPASDLMLLNKTGEIHYEHPVFE